MRLYHRHHFVVIICVYVLYILARLWGLTDSCLWFDEIFSVHAAEHGLNSLWSFVALDLIHPPLFYAILKVWIAIGGESLWWLRLLPVIFSVIVIFPFLSICAELNFSFWTRTLALFLLAVNGSLIKYSQEVRMYSLLMCLALFSTWLFVRYFEHGISLAALTIVNILLVWTHYFGWFVIASEITVILLFRPIRWKGALSMLILTLLCFIPWIVSVLTAIQNGSGPSQNIGWMSRPGIYAITQFQLNLIEPFYFQASNIDPLSIYNISVPLALIILASMVFLLINWNRSSAEEKRGFWILAIFAGIPVITAFTASWLLPYSIWGTRHLIIVFAPAFIVIAFAVSKIPVSNLRLAAVTMIILLAGYGFILRAERPTPQYIWCAWEQLLNKVDVGTETHIYAAEDVIAYHLWFAARQNEKIRVTKLEIGMPEDLAYFLPRGFDGVDRIGLADLGEKELWLAFRGSVGSTEMKLPYSASLDGFVIQEEFHVDIQNTRAYLVKVRK
jgi:uncharacterized membrane protein